MNFSRGQIHITFARRFFCFCWRSWCCSTISIFFFLPFFCKAQIAKSLFNSVRLVCRSNVVTGVLSRVFSLFDDTRKQIEKQRELQTANHQNCVQIIQSSNSIIFAHFNGIHATRKRWIRATVKIFLRINAKKTDDKAMKNFPDSKSLYSILK